MKKTILAGLLLFPFAFCAGQQVKNITSKDLQGGWSTTIVSQHSYAITHPGTTPDSDTYYSQFKIDWWVQGDSIWSFLYPYEFYHSSSFKILNDSIHFDGNKRSGGHIKLENGVLTIGEEAYHRENFDKNIVDVIKRDSINYQTLVGNMKMITWYYPEDSEPYEVKYPVTLPKYIYISSSATVRSMFGKKTLSIPVNGVRRLFYIREIDWNAYDDDSWYISSDWGGKPIITIYPAEWWKGEIFYPQFELVK